MGEFEMLDIKEAKQKYIKTYEKRNNDFMQDAKEHILSIALGMIDRSLSKGLPETIIKEEFLCYGKWALNDECLDFVKSELESRGFIVETGRKYCPSAIFVSGWDVELSKEAKKNVAEGFERFRARIAVA